MKKIVATIMLLMFFSVAFAGNAVHDRAAESECYNSEGKFEPKNKNCDPNSCGCLFHQFKDFIKDMF